jgi:rhodanese-related sulfurtransferase
MADASYGTVSTEELEGRLKTQHPDNRDPREGFALVNVLGADSYEKEHIAGSINIPAEEIDEFERRFEKDKEIVVYCASADCSASPKAAAELTERGFENVLDYEGGMSAWKDADHDVTSGAGLSAVMANFR